jgi:hypothetical protein
MSPVTLIKKNTNTLTVAALLIVLAGIFAIYFFFIRQSREAEAWHETGWLYRRGVPILNSGSALEDYQVAITMDTSALINVGKMQSDCGDIRFASRTGKELPYWMEFDNTSANSYCNSTSTKFWVRVDDIPYSASSTYPTIYAYYGNPNAEDGQNGDETFLFFDDFNKGLEKWDIYRIASSTLDSMIYYDDSAGSAYTQGDGTAKLDIPEEYSRSFVGISSKLKNFTSGFSIETYRKQTSQKFYLNIGFGESPMRPQVAGDPSYLYDPTLSNGYHLTGYTSSQSATNRLREDTLVGSAVLVNDFAGVSHSVFSRWQLRYDSSGGLWVIGNDEYKISATDTTYLTNQKSIYLAQGNNGNTVDQIIDWVFVRRYYAQETEPSMGTLQTEEKGKDPAGYWSFDEGYGTAAGDSAQNNDGIITGAAWKNEDECKSGKCLYFDGSGDYVTATGTPLDNLKTAVSVSAWVKPTALTADMGIVDKDRSAGGFVLDFDTTDKVFRFGGDGSVNAFASSTKIITAGEWYHVAGTYDGSNLKIYKNGVLEGTVANAVNFENDAASLLIGNTDDSVGFNGYIDEVRVYPYARSADEVKRDYLNGSQGKSANIGKRIGQNFNDGLIGYWKMDEVSWAGATGEVLDSSGFARHGTSTAANTTSTVKFGMSGDFNGSSSFVDVNYNYTGRDLSFSVWFKLDNLVDTCWVLNKYKSTAAAWGIRIASGSIGIYDDIKNVDSFIYTKSITSGQWYHAVVILKDDLTQELYLDGTLLGSGTKALDDLSSFEGAFYIGRRGSDEGHFEGQIDNIRVYNRALSQKEVLDLYEEAPPPILHLKFDEGTGVVANDSSGNGNNGALSGGVTWKSAGECARGGCLDFDGVNGVVTVTDADSLDIKGAITIEGWMWADTTLHAGGGESPRIIDKGNSYTVRNSLGDSGNFFTTFTGLSDVSDSTGSMPMKKWTHFATTYDQSTGKKLFYIDGKLSNSTSNVTGEIATVTTDLLIGDSPSADRYWDGKLDDIRIYNYARTQKQILEDMLGGAPITSVRAENNIVGGLVLHLDFENLGMASTTEYSNTRATVFDKSGRGNHGDVYNATSTSGKFGKGMQFSGSGYVNGGTQLVSDYPFTMSLWSKSSGGAQIPISIADKDSESIYYGLKIATTDYAVIAARNTTSYEYSGTTNVDDGNWHHIVGVWESDTLRKLYVDGVLEAVGTDNVDFSAAVDSWDIGRYGDSSPSGYITGVIDEVKFYNAALTAEEILKDYNQGKVLKVAPAQNPIAISGGSGMHPGGSGPIMHLTFDEKIGTTSTDKTGNGNDGGLADGISAPVWKGSGYCAKGGCLEFDGTNDYALAADAEILGFTTAGTVSAWVRADSLETNMGIVDKDRSASGYHLGWLAASSVFRFGRDNGGVYASSTRTFSTGQWYHLVGTYDDANLKLYVNGILEDTETFTADFTDTAAQLLIGNTDDSLFFDGRIDDVKIWNRALTAAEVAYEYNGGKPVGHWKFDEGQGDYVYDSSGNKNNGYVVIGETGDSTATSTAWQNGASGKFNGSLDFDGTDDYVDVGAGASLNITKEITISVWAKMDDVGTSIGSNQYLFAKGSVAYNDAASNSYLLFLINAGTSSEDYVRFQLSNGSSFYNVPSSTSIAQSSRLTLNYFSPNNWYHIVGTYDGTTMKIYIDGEYRASTSGPASINSLPSTNLYFGKHGDNTRFYDGKMDDVRIYNYALTPSQIQQVYNNAKALYFK